MRLFPVPRSVAGLLVVAVVGGGAFALRDRWLPWVALATSSAPAVETDAHAEDHSAAPASKPRVLELSAQARKNIGLVSKPARLQSYWRTVLIPGSIVDRPGLSDRGVTSPAVGVVTQIHAFPGDTVRPGQPLFTLRLFSEYLQNTQSELFKATGEIELVREQLARLDSAAKTGAIPEARLIELNNQVRRQNTLILAYRQDLLTRGLSPAQIEDVAKGRFVSTIEVAAPPVSFKNQALLPAPRDGRATDVKDENVRPAALEVANPPANPEPANPNAPNQADEPAFEYQELQVELGQQVQAGQLLAQLSNHQSLYVAGHAFKPEAPYLERTAQERRAIDIEFAEDDDAHWPKAAQRFEIRHLANAINPETRTFDFFIPLVNQSRGYDRDGEAFVVWRYRPGQRARLHVPVEEFRDVFVVPAAAVVHEGPEAFVFRQNGDLFDRRAVRVLYEDRRHAVLEPDGSVTPGMYLAQSAAATLNRVLKSQAAGGETPGLHVHADGTVHGAH